MQQKHYMKPLPNSAALSLAGCTIYSINLKANPYQFATLGQIFTSSPLLPSDTKLVPHNICAGLHLRVTRGMRSDTRTATAAFVAAAFSVRPFPLADAFVVTTTGAMRQCFECDLRVAPASIIARHPVIIVSTTTALWESIRTDPIDCIKYLELFVGF